MSLRQRITSGMSSSSGLTKAEEEISKLKNRINELDTIVLNLRNLLDISRYREKKLSSALEQSGLSITVSLDIEDGGLGAIDDPSLSPDSDSKTFIPALTERAGWLIGLLIFQSCSSFILSANNNLLETHPAIIYFLTSNIMYIYT